MEWHKRGRIAENYFSTLLYKHGMDYEFVDSWYDYKIQGLKVEVKSCQLSISNRDKAIRNNPDTDYFQVGRFDFHNGLFREKIKSETIWIALIIRHHKECMLYGFIKSDQIPKTRYLSIHKARTLSPITFEDWIGQNGLECKHKRLCPFCGRIIDGDKD